MVNFVRTGPSTEDLQGNQKSFLHGLNTVCHLSQPNFGTQNDGLWFLGLKLSCHHESEEFDRHFPNLPLKVTNPWQIWATN